MIKHPTYPIKSLVLALFLTTNLVACGGNKPTSTRPGKSSTATGLPFNKEGGFQVKPARNQASGPGLVFIDGGTTVIGVFGEDTSDGAKRAVTVTSFYLKETEVTNVEWKEYLFDLKTNGSDEAYKAAQLDEKVWVRELGYNDPYVHNYNTEEGFNYYPVVGVTWTQANNYCNWLTKKMREQELEKKGGKPAASDQTDESDDSDETDDSDDSDETDQTEDATDTPAAPTQAATTPVDSTSENSVTGYRLPTEVEWEYAARAMVGTQDLNFVQSTQRVYPWGDGLSLRGQEGEWQGKYLANFKRSKGNYKGLAGESNSNGPTSYVWAYPPNDLGLYDMGGNVSEWVVDLYRPNSFQDFEDFNPVRRDDTLDPEKDYDPHNSLINNRSRVYKGASWKDCAYWAQIGTRRFLDQDSCTATIGFRYAMTSMGGGEDR